MLSHHLRASYRTKHMSSCSPIVWPDIQTPGTSSHLPLLKSTTKPLGMKRRRCSYMALLLGLRSVVRQTTVLTLGCPHANLERESSTPWPQTNQRHLIWGASDVCLHSRLCCSKTVGIQLDLWPWPPTPHPPPCPHRPKTRLTKKQDALIPFS